MEQKERKVRGSIPLYSGLQRSFRRYSWRGVYSLRTAWSAVFDAVLFSYLIPNFGWVFILSSFGFLAFSVYLAASRYGRIRLGGDDERPEFSTVSWVAMMFSAGMGIGLMFFGVAEPMSHMGTPPVRSG